MYIDTEVVLLDFMKYKELIIMPEAIPALPIFDPDPKAAVTQCRDVYVQVTKLCKTDATAIAVATGSSSLISLAEPLGKYIISLRVKGKIPTAEERQTCIGKLTAFYNTFADAYRKQKAGECLTGRAMDRILNQYK